MERMTRIELALSAWESHKIPRWAATVAGQGGIEWPGVTCHCLP